MGAGLFTIAAGAGDFTAGGRAVGIEAGLAGGELAAIDCGATCVRSVGVAARLSAREIAASEGATSGVRLIGVVGGFAGRELTATGGAATGVRAMGSVARVVSCELATNFGGATGMRVTGIGGGLACLVAEAIDEAMSCSRAAGVEVAFAGGTLTTVDCAASDDWDVADGAIRIIGIVATAFGAG